MPIKKNIYKNLNLEDSIKELRGNIEALSAFDLRNLDDDIEFMIGANGVMQPVVISSIEQKMDSTVVTMKDSIEQLRAISSVQGVDEFTKWGVQQIKWLIEEIYKYYEERPASNITHRYYEWTKTTARGKSYNCKKLCANAPTINKSRSKTFRIITDIKPIISILENNEKEIVLKGGKVMPERLKYVNRNKDE